MSDGLHDVVMLFVVGLAGFPILFPLSIFALFCQSSLSLAINYITLCRALCIHSSPQMTSERFKDEQVYTPTPRSLVQYACIYIW